MKLSFPLILWLALALPASAQQKAIAASDADALEAALGKTVIVTGTVKSFEAEDKGMPAELRFADSELRVYIDPEDYWKGGGGWGLEAYIDKALFVHGQIVKAGEGLQMRIKGENHFHEELDALIAGLPKPKPKDKKAEEAKIEPVASGAVLPVNPGEADLAPKLTAASVKVILPKFAGGPPEFVFSKVDAEIVDLEAEDEAEPAAEDEEGEAKVKTPIPMQATFELKPKIGVGAMTNAMTYLPKKYKAQGWPRDKSAHFVIDEVQADSAPPNFAAAVLIDAMLSGVEIPENVVLFGGIDKNGKITRKGDKERADAPYVRVIELAASGARPPADPEEEELPKPDKTLFLITGNVPDGTIDDLIIDEDWDTLNSTIVLRCVDVAEAMHLISDIAAGGSVGKTINDLAAAQGVLRERSIRMLSNDGVWSRVVAAGKAFSGNATAYGYARMRTRTVAKTYSLDRCIAHIHDAIEITRGDSLDKYSSRERRKYMRDLTSEMNSIENKIHPDAEALLAAAENYLKEIEDLADAKQKDAADIPERVTTAHAEAAKAYNEARAAAQKKLAGDS